MMEYLQIYSNQGGVVFGMFQTWNGSLGHREVVFGMSNLEWQFETCGEFVLGISLWLCELSGLESLWN